MKPLRAGSGVRGWGWVLLAVFMLLAAPVMPAAATPMDDGCAMPSASRAPTGGAPKGDDGSAAQSLCGQTCGVACQLLTPPAPVLTAPLPRAFASLTPRLARLLSGREIAPDLPPPR
ncbi:hypothetical protein BH09PSE2_BH09PSE2_25120 [soil metagenome]